MGQGRLSKMDLRAGEGVDEVEANGGEEDGVAFSSSDLEVLIF